MTHICVNKLNHHLFRKWLVDWPAPSHYLNKCLIVVNWTLRNKLQLNLNRSSNISIQENAFERVVCETAAILSRPQCDKVGSYWAQCGQFDNGIVNKGIVLFDHSVSISLFRIIAPTLEGNTRWWVVSLAIWGTCDLISRILAPAYVCEIFLIPCLFSWPPRPRIREILITYVVAVVLFEGV